MTMSVLFMTMAVLVCLILVVMARGGKAEMYGNGIWPFGGQGQWGMSEEDVVQRIDPVATSIVSDQHAAQMPVASVACDTTLHPAMHMPGCYVSPVTARALGLSDDDDEDEYDEDDEDDGED